MVAPWVAVKSSCATPRECHLNEREISQPALRMISNLAPPRFERVRIISPSWLATRSASQRHREVDGPTSSRLTTFRSTNVWFRIGATRRAEKSQCRPATRADGRLLNPTRLQTVLTGSSSRRGPVHGRGPTKVTAAARSTASCRIANGRGLCRAHILGRLDPPSLWATNPATAPNGHRSGRPLGYWPNGRDFRPMVDDVGHRPNGHLRDCGKRRGPRWGQMWATHGPQSKTPTFWSALNYSKLLFLFWNFGCEGRI